MNLDPKLIDEVLKQNGIESDRFSQEEQERLRQITAKENARIIQMRKINIGLWIGTGIVMTLFFLQQTLYPNYFNDYRESILLLLLTYLFAFFPWAAIISTVLYFSRTVMIRQKQNQRQLALIEDALRQLLKKEHQK